MSNPVENVSFMRILSFALFAKTSYYILLYFHWSHCITKKYFFILLCVKIALNFFHEDCVWVDLILHDLFFIFLRTIAAEKHSYEDLKSGSLHNAVNKRNAKEIKNLIRKGRNPNTIGEDYSIGYPPIFTAIGNCDAATLKVLLDEGADVNWKLYGVESTALHFVIRLFNETRKANLMSCFNILMDRPDIDIDWYVKPEYVRLILPLNIRKAQVYSDTFLNPRKLYYGTPLAIASRLGCNRMVEKLLLKGADVSQVEIDFKCSFKYRPECRLYMKLLYYSGFNRFPKNSKVIQRYSNDGYDEFKQWLDSVSDQPLSLKAVARIVIRRSVGKNIRGLYDLNLPTQITDYLLLKDVQSDSIRC